MKKLALSLASTALLGACASGMNGSNMASGSTASAGTVMVGGAAMYPSRDIVLKTASGGNLYATSSGSNVMITDDKGGTATVSISNVYQSNGVIHVVNKVLLPG